MTELTKVNQISIQINKAIVLVSEQIWTKLNANLNYVWGDGGLEGQEATITTVDGQFFLIFHGEATCLNSAKDIVEHFCSVDKCNVLTRLVQLDASLRGTRSAHC